MTSDPTASLQTSMGTIVLRLLPDYAPKTVRNNCAAELRPTIQRFWGYNAGVSDFVRLTKNLPKAA